jgi:hypothetical protein
MTPPGKQRGRGQQRDEHPARIEARHVPAPEREEEEQKERGLRDTDEPAAARRFVEPEDAPRIEKRQAGENGEKHDHQEMGQHERQPAPIRRGDKPRGPA